MPGKRKSSFQNVLSDNFVHLHCHQPSAIKHNNKRKKQRKEKARAENEVEESLLTLEQIWTLGSIGFARVSGS